MIPQPETLSVDGCSRDLETQLASLAVVGKLRDIMAPKNISSAILSVQKALDDLQTKQYLLREQLLYYWIKLQLLQQQGALCLQTYEALTQGGCDVADAILHFMQYYSRSSALPDQLIHLIHSHQSRFPTMAHQGQG